MCKPARTEQRVKHKRAWQRCWPLRPERKPHLWPPRDSHHYLLISEKAFFGLHIHIVSLNQPTRASPIDRRHNPQYYLERLARPGSKTLLFYLRPADSSRLTEITLSMCPIGILQAQVHSNSHIVFTVLGVSSICRAQLSSRTISLLRYPCFQATGCDYAGLQDAFFDVASHHSE